MKSLICKLEGFAETWLDPWVWIFRLRTGIALTVDGHLNDLDHRRYEVRDGKEFEYVTCTRCGLERNVGWRYMG